MASKTFSHNVKRSLFVLREVVHDPDHENIQVVHKLGVQDSIGEEIRCKTKTIADWEVQVDHACIVCPGEIVIGEV